MVRVMVSRMPRPLAGVIAGVIMPRTYRRKPDVRPYKCYTNEELESIIKEIELKNVSAREAHRRYGIHRNVLNKKLKLRRLQLKEDGSPPVRPHGGQTVLPQDVERNFVSHILAIASFGFPFTTLDLRVAVQSYLNKIDRRVEQFRNNLPGMDWARLFLERHQIQLTQRISQNITQPRGDVDSCLEEGTRLLERITRGHNRKISPKTPIPQKAEATDEQTRGEQEHQLESWVSGLWNVPIGSYSGTGSTFQ
ncbi:hypothetical protein GE061_019137 [Apolygus lucorum]|uniref:HTH psq-type domain-containing protein n=1 Tax=Apolygus lucorum TaxID=248454 RepID=A0A8S9X792_APOLU|nr:hypothetical protein GE061_019137 [Apolygus lucorum]